MQQSVSVPFGGSATLLNQGLQAGAIVYNTDTKNTVWVSANPACAPGNGIPLAPLASVTWSATGPIYACCDSGVASNVGLILSTDAVQYSNPEAVATATAAQLLAQGIPSVLTGSSIPAANMSQPFDVSGFASVSGTVNINGTGQGVLSFVFYDETNTIIVYHKNYTFAGPWAGFQFSTPVYGPNLQVSFTNGNAGNLRLYGSNRMLPEKCYTQCGNSGSKNLTFPANTATLLNSSTLVSNGGPASINVRCTSGLVTATGDFAIQYWDTLQNSVSTLQIGTTSQMVSTEGSYTLQVNGIILPPGGVNVQYYNNGAATAGIALYSMIFN